MTYVGHLAVVTRAGISLSEENNIPATSLQVKKIFIRNTNFSVDITLIFSNYAQKQIITHNYLMD